MTTDASALLRFRTTITVEEAASMLGISRSSAYEAVRNGEIPSLRIGRRCVIPVHPLLDLLGISPADLEDC